MENREIVFAKLEKLKERSYSPYSKFRVSAIVNLKNGNEIVGINIENAAFGSTICAERSALAQVYSLGFRKADIQSIDLSTDSDGYGSPCGSCRQVMSELMDSNSMMSIYNKKGFVDEITIGDLLPHNFTNKNL